MANLVRNHETWEKNSDFTPISDLFNPDGDTVLVFLTSNGIEFWDAVTDPWYRATIPGAMVHMTTSGKEIMVYQSEEAASPMGCVRQYQFCNPSLSSHTCGPLASWDDAQKEAAPLFGISTEDWDNLNFPPTGNNIGSRYVWLMYLLASAQTNIEESIGTLGPESLTSLKHLSSGTMGALPSNQWQLDVRYWWATYLASIQAALVNVARGPTDPALDPYKMLPFDSHARDMCNNQVRYLSVQSFVLKLR